MKVIVVIGMILAMSYVAMCYTDQEEGEFESFKSNFARSYSSPEEEGKRKAIFVENLQRINEHNKLYEQGKSTYKMGVNQFADLRSDEVPTGLLRH